MSQVNVERFDDFTGGLNLRADQFQLKRNESPDMLNVEVDPRGGLFSRGAMREINSTAVAYTGTWNPERLFNFSGTTPYVMLCAEGKVYKSTGANFTTLQYSSGNDITATSSHGACMAQWGEYMYMVTGSGSSNGGYRWIASDTYATSLSPAGTNPNNWQTTIDASVHHLPKAEHMIVHANKLIVANTNEGGVAYPNRVRWSIEGAPENWIQDDYIDFEGGGLGINAVAVVQGQLVVFKPRAVYVVYGYDKTDFQVVELTAKLGLQSHHHMCVAENGVYFYSHPQGIFYYNGNSLTNISLNINPIFPLGYINDASVIKISLSYMNRRVWIAMPYSKTTTSSDLTVNFIYDPQINNGTWSLHSTGDGYAVCGGVDWTNASGTSMALAVHATKPRVLRCDMYGEETDLIGGTETSFESYYRTGWIDGQTYSMKKMFRRPDIIVKQADTPRIINVKVFHNFEEAFGNEKKTFNINLPSSVSGMVWGEGRWGSGEWGVQAQGGQLYRGTNLGLARSVQLLFTGPTGNSWGIDSVSYKFNTRKVTG
jgi:hypothetical protein